MSQVTPSQVKTAVSVTQSEVSQVDFKMQANSKKIKLKNLLKNVDSDKSGFVKHEVFFELLELHNVKIPPKAQTYLKNNFSKNQTINYKEAVNQLTIDLRAAGGTDEDANNAEMKWTILALAKNDTAAT